LSSGVLALTCVSVLIAYPAAAHADDTPIPDGDLLAAPVTVPSAPMVARVHIAADTPVRLESRAPASAETGWTTACTAPCDRNLPVYAEYRVVSAAGGALGEPFRLDASASHTLTVEVVPRSRARQATGTAMIGVGVAGAVISAAGVLTFTIAASRPPSGPACEPHDRGDPGISCGLGQGLAAALAIFCGVGLLASGGVIVGGAALLSSSHEKTTQKPTFARAATWVGPTVAASGKSAFVLPLSFSF